MANQASRPWRTLTIGVATGVFLLLFGLFLPHCINLGPVKGKIVAQLSQRIGAPIMVRQIRLKLLPTPAVRLEQVSFSLGETLTGTIDSVNAYPELMSLLTGAVKLRSLSIVKPNLQLKPAAVVSSELEGNTTPRPTERLVDSVIDTLRTIRARTPSGSIQLEDGQLEYLEGGALSFRLEQVNGRLESAPERVLLAIECRSNRWRHGVLSVQLGAAANMEGTIRLEGFQPRFIYDHLFPATDLKLTEAQLDLTAQFKSDTLTEFDLHLQGADARVVVEKPGQTVAISGRGFTIAVQSNPHETVIKLGELVLDAPRLNLAGTFAKRTSPTPFALTLEGKDIDVDAVRHTALALLGDYGDTRKIFEILVGGTVPTIAFSTHGNQVQDLGKAENIEIAGRLNQGKLFIPKAKLDLTEVYGDVVIVKGILSGKELRAELGNSRGVEGDLRVGLVGKNAPFHLDIRILADLAQLPPILLRVVRNKPFTAELEKIKSFAGSARGRMVLGDSLDSIDAVVDVGDIRLTGSYERLPYPVTISGGNFYYNETEKIVAVKDLDGSLAGSTFAAVSGELTWVDKMQLTIGVGSAALAVDEIYPWLVSYPTVRRKLNAFKFGGGNIVVDSLSLKGPLLEPRRWDFELSGSIRNVAMDWTVSPDTLRIAAGRFQCTPQKLVFTQARATVLDSSLTASVTLHRFLNGLSSAELNVAGEVGQKTIKWLADLRHIPPELYVRAPLTVNNGRLVWQRDAEISFSARLLPAGGPRVSIDQVRHKERLIIKRLLIEDDESTAVIALDLQPQVLDFSFSGNLTKATADKLLQDNTVLMGWVRGDFKAHVQMERNMESTAVGTLQGEGLKLPIMDGVGRVDRFSVAAVDNLLRVDSAVIYWQEHGYRLNGTITFCENRLLLDMNTATDEVGWEKIDELANAIGKTGGRPGPFADLRLLGIVRVEVGAFGFDTFTWNPFHADVHFKSNGMEILITRAELCSVQMPGTIRWADGKLNWDFTPRADNQQLNATLACLFAMQGLTEGPYSFSGEITGELGERGFVRSLQGPIAFNAKNGRIYRFSIIERLFSILNFTEIFRGRLPDLRREGFGYELVTVEGNLDDGRLVIEESVIKGNSVEMVGQGWIDLTTRRVDLTILVAPFKTLDTILGYIPLINGILGRIVSVPVRVTGTLANPVVVPLSPTAVGAGLLGIMKRTLQLPLRIIQPLMPAANGKTNNSNGAVPTPPPEASRR